MNDPRSNDLAASPLRRDGVGGGRHSTQASWRASGGHAAAARAWLAQTFNGLTWKSFAIFCLVVEFVALHQGPSINALRSGFPWMVPSIFPWMPVGAEGLAKAFIHMFLLFFPVFLAVIAVENRGPRQGKARVWFLFAAVVVGQILGTILYSTAITWLYPDGFMRFSLMTDPVRKWGVLAGVGVRYLGFSTAAVGCYYFFKRDAEAAAALHRETLEREDSQRENAEARLQVMQAQIEPHFLFNTLASVRRLYQIDRSSGRSMLRHLSRYLTSSLPEMRESRPTLERELALALAYLSVQKIRMESRLTFDVNVPKGLKEAIVPPMMLATLVENAVIHGVGPLSSGGHIGIIAYAESGKLFLEVADNGRGLKETWGGGVGLANIRARLHSAFGSNAQLQLRQRRGGGAIATITLPLATGVDAKAA